MPKLHRQKELPVESDAWTTKVQIWKPTKILRVLTGILSKKRMLAIQKLGDALV